MSLSARQKSRRRAAAASLSELIAGTSNSRPWRAEFTPVLCERIKKPWPRCFSATQKASCPAAASESHFPLAGGVSRNRSRLKTQALDRHAPRSVRRLAATTACLKLFLHERRRSDSGQKASNMVVLSRLPRLRPNTHEFRWTKPRPKTYNKVGKPDLRLALVGQQPFASTTDAFRTP